MAKSAKKTDKKQGAKNITVKTTLTADELFKLVINTPVKSKKSKDK